MGKFIIKLPCDGVDYYLEWSTVVDAPATYGMTLEEFTDYYQEEYGRAGSTDLQSRLERCEKNGCSSLRHKNIDELISENRAGDGETDLSREGIIEKYIRNRPRE